MEIKTPCLESQTTIVLSPEGTTLPPVQIGTYFDHEECEKDLRRRQQEHLDNVRRLSSDKTAAPWQRCAHPSCSKHDTAGCKTVENCNQANQPIFDARQ